MIDMDLDLRAAALRGSGGGGAGDDVRDGVGEFDSGAITFAAASCGGSFVTDMAGVGGRESGRGINAGLAI